MAELGAHAARLMSSPSSFTGDKGGPVSLSKEVGNRAFEGRTRSSHDGYHWHVPPLNTVLAQALYRNLYTASALRAFETLLNITQRSLKSFWLAQGCEEKGIETPGLYLTFFFLEGLILYAWCSCFW